MPKHLHVQQSTALSTSAVVERRIQCEENGSAGGSGVEAVAHHHYHERPAASPAIVGVRTPVVGVLKQGSAFLQDSGGEARVGTIAIALQHSASVDWHERIEISGFGKEDATGRWSSRCRPQSCPGVISGVGVTASAQQDGGDSNTGVQRG